MARFTSIGMARKRFVSSAAEEQAAKGASASGDIADAGAGSSTAQKSASEAIGGGGGRGESNEDKKKKKRRGRERVKDESGKRVAVGDKKGFDDGRKFRPGQIDGDEGAVEGGWGRDMNVARRSRLSADHATARREKRQRPENKNANTTCFACRSVGHAARDCPNVLLAASGGDPSALPSEGAEAEAYAKRGMKRKAGKSGGELAGNKCYRCNSNTHSLSACPESVDPTNPTPYATCYICLGSGHLASLCPSNPGRGVYPKGGSCKVCGSVAHRAKDCPDDKRQSRNEGEEGEEGGRKRKGEVLLGTGDRAGADEDDFMVIARDDLKAGASAGAGGKKKKHLPARNGERPMKRLREAGAEEGPTGRFDEVEKAHAEAQAQGQDTPALEAVPLTARKAATSAGQSKVKTKAKVVAF